MVLILYNVFYYNHRNQDVDHFSKTKILRLLDEAKKENTLRILHLRKTCQFYNLGLFKTIPKPLVYKEPPTPQYEIFYYDQKHKLSWCPIYKAGSSTWLYNFALLGGSTQEQITNSKLQISHFVRNIFASLTSLEAIKFIPTSLKFVIVRHPFERILSAYRDKLENITTHNKTGALFYYKKYGKKIVSKYRLGNNSTNVRSILKEGQFLWKKNEEPVGVEPTFREFVRYLIDTDLNQRADDHWIPFYLFCTPCLLKYDIIGKVETMQQDQLLIIYTANLQDKIEPQWRHKTNPFAPTGYNEVSEISKIYFSQLYESDVKQLYEKYKLDFELFQYDAAKYYKYVMK